MSIRAWLKLSQRLGDLVSTVILTVLFFGLVTPVGLARRVLGKDVLRLKKWKRGAESVFLERNHLYESSDLDHPY